MAAVRIYAGRPPSFLTSRRLDSIAWVGWHKGRPDKGISLAGGCFSEGRKLDEAQASERVKARIVNDF
jgi:hypothetical protein